MDIYKIPQNVFDNVIRQLGDEEGNELKLMFVFLSLPGDGSIKIEEDKICQKLNMSSQEYHEAIKNLSARGWIDMTIENIIVVSFEAILGKE